MTELTLLVIMSAIALLLLLLMLLLLSGMARQEELETLSRRLEQKVSSCISLQQHQTTTPKPPSPKNDSKYCWSYTIGETVVGPVELAEITFEFARFMSDLIINDRDTWYAYQQILWKAISTKKRSISFTRTDSLPYSEWIVHVKLWQPIQPEEL